MKRILILCTGNSCRSQMAEGYLRHFGGSRLEVYSAGVETHGLSPKAVQVMEEDGIDISAHTSNHVEEYRHIPFDYVVTVCDHAREVCPVLPGASQTIHHTFPDPAKAEGDPIEVMKAFREVRDSIREWSRDFVSSLRPS